MKWIIAIFIILDSFFQLFATPFSPFWSTYYDVSHYGVLLAISFFLFSKSKVKIYGLFSAYFAFIVFVVLLNYRVQWSDYIQRIDSAEPIYYISFIILILIGFFAYNKIRNGKV